MGESERGEERGKQERGRWREIGKRGFMREDGTPSGSRHAIKKIVTQSNECENRILFSRAAHELGF